jgi:hypothetical protein
MLKLPSLVERQSKVLPLKIAFVCLLTNEVFINEIAVRKMNELVFRDSFK